MTQFSTADQSGQLPKSAQRWRMPLLLRISAVLHAAMLLLTLVVPAAWGWALVVLGLNHVLITVTGLLPRSNWLGHNYIRLPPASIARREIALTIDDGPDPTVTPLVLDLLAQHNIKATFFCIGAKAALHPALCRSIAERGHFVENHSQQHHHWFSLMGGAGMHREIVDAQQTLATITGRAPRFFRAPAGLRNPFLDPVLTQLQLPLVAWSRRGYDTKTTNAAVVCQRLLKGLAPGAILLVHDGNCAGTIYGTPVLLEVLPMLFSAARKADLHFVTLDHAIPHQ